MIDEERPEDEAAEEQVTEGEPAAEEAAPPAPEEEPTPEAEAEEPPAEEAAPPAPEEEPTPEAEAEEPPAEAEAPPAPPEEPAPAAQAEAPPAAEPPSAEARAKPEIPGADLEVDIVPEGSDPLAAAEAARAELEEAAEPIAPAEPGEPKPAAVPRAAIDLAADARYTATGKRKTAIARVVLRPGSGAYAVNGRTLEEYFPRATAQRNIREPLETVGYEARMDVVASLHGGGVAAQAGALRHGIARALIEADPNLRVELKRRGFLTRDARVKERRKAGLKKARKRPQFSKR